MGTLQIHADKIARLETWLLKIEDRLQELEDKLEQHQNQTEGVHEV